jgi:hypothetical protein
MKSDKSTLNKTINNMKRRDFLRTGTMIAGSLMIPFSLPGKRQKVKLAILGTGWWGTEVLLQTAMLSGHFEIVGLCDINSVALENAANAVVDAGGNKPELFASYKEMYEMPGLQAVVISTPTHWHALQFIDACKKGLHVFLEKPISYDIREGQAMLAAQQQTGNIVQVDFPRVMGNVNDEVKAYIESGEAGKILQVRANINHQDGNVVEKEIPETLDFETFCGPAPRTKFLCYPNGNTPAWREQFECRHFEYTGRSAKDDIMCGLW